MKTLKITKSVKAKIDKAHQECKKGNCIKLSSHEDIDKYFDSL